MSNLSGTADIKLFVEWHVKLVRNYEDSRYKIICIMCQRFQKNKGRVLFNCTYLLFKILTYLFSLQFQLLSKTKNKTMAKKLKFSSLYLQVFLMFLI